MKRLVFVCFCLLLLNSTCFISQAAALNRFVDLNNGAMLDTKTNLIWLKNANCYGAISWANAMSSANVLASDQCGLTDGSKAGDWRIPSIDELRTITDSGFRYDTMNNAGFTSVM